MFVDSSLKAAVLGVVGLRYTQAVLQLIVLGLLALPVQVDVLLD